MIAVLILFSVQIVVSRPRLSRRDFGYGSG
jgi:hypothetical protein